MFHYTREPVAGLDPLKAFVRNHPLLLVLLAAALLRLPAVLWSKGYMASDDYFETVEVAYEWLTVSPWHEDGIRMWAHRPAQQQTRFPLYILSLYAIMKGGSALGLTDLDSIMYPIRALHALLSLLAVWAMFEIVLALTRSRTWAVVAGLVAAGFYVLPFLSVRNLIEMVGGNIWIVAILLLYRYRESGDVRRLWGAGVVAGLAWMIRFEIAFVVLPVPLLLWYQHRSLRPAAHFAGAVLAMVLAASVADFFLLNGFAASTISHLRQIINEPPPYQTPHLLYLYVILGLFLPPLSVLILRLWVQRRAMVEHAVLWGSTAFFLVAHTLSPSRQERYLLPVLPALLLMTVVALWYHFRAGGYLFRSRRLGKSLLGLAMVMNVALLVPFSIDYGHKGVVEPFVRIARYGFAHPVVMVVSPESGGLYAWDYGGRGGVQREAVRSWPELEQFAERPGLRDSIAFYLLYPPSESQLPAYVDSLQARVGLIREEFHVRASLIDRVLHRLNPAHNPTKEVWVFRPDRR